MNLATGTRVGVYTVVCPLGAGGMGEVYRAHDARLGREVALKILRQDGAADPDQVRRFSLEARAVAALNHPNILTIYDVSDSADLPFMATELVVGETLRDRLARGPLTVAETLDIAIQIADGLAHAHDARIVHRDLKPQNVMVKPDGHVKILDFGLGKVFGPIAASDGSTASTASTLTGPATTVGKIVGTAGYMSPEQVTGRPVDGRSDQFSLGALLYEMLTGRRAFSRDTTIETISSVLSDDPKPPLSTLAPSVPPSLVAIVERCLEKKPERRYASTRDLVHDLEHVRAELADTRTRFRPGPVRWRAVALVSVLLAAIVFVAVAALVVVRRPSAGGQQIAVLPFTNIQRDPANDAFADGIVELLTTNLTQLEKTSASLRVVPAADVRRYGVASAKEARQTFGATLVVSGSIQRSADVVRLTLNLIDSATQQQRSARVIDARGDNPLALQDQAFAVLASMLGAGVEPATKTALQTGSTLVPGAYDFYVQGRGYLQRYERLDNVENAIALFRRAIDADARFAMAHASLGEALWRKYELTKDTSLIADARAACAKATAINDQTAPVHLTLSMIARGTGQYESAVAEAQKALALDRTNADATEALARAYDSLGRFSDAESAYKAAVAARPGDWAGHNELGVYYYGRKNYQAALQEFRRATELTPDNAKVYSNIGGIQFLLGQYEEARTSYQRSVGLKPSADAYSNLGTLEFRLQRFSEAAKAFKEATALTPNSYVFWGNLASAYARAGHPTEATAAYRRAIAVAERDRTVNPNRASLIADLAGFYANLGEADTARAYAHDALLLDSGNTNVMMSVAVTYNVLGERESAIRLILRALDAAYPPAELAQRYALKELLSDPRVRKRLDSPSRVSSSDNTF